VLVNKGEETERVPPCPRNQPGQVLPQSLPHYVVTSLLRFSESSALSVVKFFLPKKGGLMTVREQPREPRRPSDLVSCLHKLTNCPLGDSHLSTLLQMPRGGMGLPTPNIPTFKSENALTPVESALPKNTRVTPSESALPKTQDLKSFRIRTCKKGWGEGMTSVRTWEARRRNATDPELDGLRKRLKQVASFFVKAFATESRVFSWTTREGASLANCLQNRKI